MCVGVRTADNCYGITSSITTSVLVQRSIKLTYGINGWDMLVTSN